MDEKQIAAFATEYLHEDWAEEHSDFMDLLSRYVEENSRADQVALGQSLAELLSATETDEQTERWLLDHDWQVFFDDVPIRIVLRQMSDMLLAE